MILLSGNLILAKWIFFFQLSIQPLKQSIFFLKKKSLSSVWVTVTLNYLFFREQKSTQCQVWKSVEVC